MRSGARTQPSSRELREQVFDDGGAGTIYHREHQIEYIGATVIWIRYVEVAVLTGVELSEEFEHGVSITLRLQIAKVPKIAAIHRKDVVEIVEVFDAHAPGVPPECNPVSHRDVGGARVGRVSFVPRARARRVDTDPVGEALLLQTVRQDPFSERRTADVAQAYEKN